MTRLVRRAPMRVVAVAVAALLTAACSSAVESGAGPAPSPSATAPTPAAPTAAPARPAPVPRVRDCYALVFADAAAATIDAPTVDCADRHTSRTVFVGRLSRLVDGAVDSARVQQAVARACPRRVSVFLGGPEQASRLSMFRPVWFTPTLEDAALGADWFRCDVTALSGSERLLPLAGRLEGVLDRAVWKPTYGLCGTAEPGTADFARVACGRPHSWRALSTVPLAGQAYPGEAVVRDAGAEPCRATARATSDDPLDFRWGYEWPTLDQWRAGARYGVCWAPATTEE